MNVAMKELPCILTLLLILAGCGLFGTEGDEPNARISEDGVDGVRFGDTMAEVQRKLGSPEKIGLAHGADRAWIAADYRSKGPSAGIIIYFLEKVDRPDSLYPVDQFNIYHPFSGRTERGIGIGATSGEVEQAYGEPLDSIVTELNTGIARLLFYCIGKRDLEISIRDDTVSAMFLRQYEPYPDLPGVRQYCNE